MACYYQSGISCAGTSIGRVPCNERNTDSYWPTAIQFPLKMKSLKFISLRNTCANSPQTLNDIVGATLLFPVIPCIRDNPKTSVSAKFMNKGMLLWMHHVLSIGWRGEVSYPNLHLQVLSLADCCSLIALKWLELPFKSLITSSGFVVHSIHVWLLG